MTLRKRPIRSIPSTKLWMRSIISCRGKNDTYDTAHEVHNPDGKKAGRNRPYHGGWKNFSGRHQTGKPYDGKGAETAEMGEMCITDEIREALSVQKDTAYRDFQAKLIPTIDKETVIGVRTPALRKMAKQLAKREEIGEFLRSLPHTYFEENQLHAFIIAQRKDFAQCMEELSVFLPYVDNWATCDQLLPKVFQKHRQELLPYIREWLASAQTYTVRFGIGMLMGHFLDEDFDRTYPDMVSKVRSEEYYVNMMIAWYFATALAKQYEAVLPYIEEKKLADWTHNKAIQKAVESYRITPEQKEYLRGLKVSVKK